MAKGKVNPSGIRGNRANFVISVLVTVGALMYFSSTQTTGPHAPVSSGVVPMTDGKSKETPPPPTDDQAARLGQMPTAIAGKSATPPTVIPSAPIAPTAVAPSQGASQNQEVSQGATQELPEDLQRQLAAPPPELPADLKAQLAAPPPELPEDMKRALRTPPRIVSIDEVNNPNYRPAPDAPVAAPNLGDEGTSNLGQSR